MHTDVKANSITSSLNVDGLVECTAKINASSNHSAVSKLIDEVICRFMHEKEKE